MYDEKFIIDSINNNSRKNIEYIYPTKSSEEIAKYISAFSNNAGGIILFGVKDTGTRLEKKGYNFNIHKTDLMKFVDSHAIFDIYDIKIIINYICLFDYLFISCLLYTSDAADDMQV